MNLVAIEAPATRVSLPGEALELLDATLRVVSASHGLQVVADHLVEALAQSFRLLAGSGDQLLVDGESDVHGHSIRGHILCVNLNVSAGGESCRSRSMAASMMIARDRERVRRVRCHMVQCGKVLKGQQ